MVALEVNESLAEGDLEGEGNLEGLAAATDDGEAPLDTAAEGVA